MAFRLRVVWAWETPAAPPLPSCRGAGDSTDDSVIASSAGLDGKGFACVGGVNLPLAVAAMFYSTHARHHAPGK